MIDVRLVTGSELPVPDPDLPRFADALRAAGRTVDTRSWRDPGVDWSEARVTVLRSPWDYVARVDDFVRWVRAVEPVTNLWNPAGLVEWNVHKSYLLDLGSRGAPVVPTVMLPHGSGASLDGVADAQGWNALVVKPAVGVGAEGAGRFDVGDRAGQEHLDGLLATGDVLVQPFVPSIEREGELSIVCFDGRVSHVLRKFPGAGDYRVQENWGGGVEAARLDDAPAPLAEQVCSVLPAPTLYARIDVLRIADRWHVLEVEVTEPALWLDLAPPDSTGRLVDATIARLG